MSGRELTVEALKRSGFREPLLVAAGASEADTSAVIRGPHSSA